MMHRLFILIFACLVPVLAWGQESPQVSVPTDSAAIIMQPDTVVKKQNRFQRIKSRIKERIDNKLSEPYDTARTKGYWWRAMKHGKVNFNDSTMGYPKFLRFCWRTYKWGDRAFNSYDTSYVKSTGKNWKLILKSDNWIDSYIGRPYDDMRMVVNSNLVSNIGVSLSFMAVSVGYSVAVSNLVHGGKLSNKVDFSFTCARFAADAYYWENKNEVNVTYTDKRIDDQDHEFRMSGITRKAMGLTAYYFFNNRRYAQAAAYCFSKYQRRSAGSWLAGISLQHFDVQSDVEKMPETTRELIPTQEDAPRILYNDYCLLAGYGYNWVLGRKWLLNFTVTPYVGYRYNHKKSNDENVSKWSLNLRARIGAVYNHKKMFVGLQGYADHHRYKSKGTYLINSTINFVALVGIRF